MPYRTEKMLWSSSLKKSRNASLELNAETTSFGASGTTRVRVPLLTVPKRAHITLKH